MKRNITFLFALFIMSCNTQEKVQRRNQKTLSTCALREIYLHLTTGPYTNELYNIIRKEDSAYLDMQFIIKDSIFTIPNQHFIVRKKDCKVIYEDFNYGKPLKDTCISIYYYDKK